MVVTTGAICRAKLQSNHYHQQTNTKSFFTDRMPFLSPNQQCYSTGKQRTWMVDGVKIFVSSSLSMQIYGRCFSYGICPCRRSQSLGGCWAPAPLLAWLTLEMPPRKVCYAPNLVTVKPYGVGSGPKYMLGMLGSHPLK